MFGWCWLLWLQNFGKSTNETPCHKPWTEDAAPFVQGSHLWFGLHPVLLRTSDQNSPHLWAFVKTGLHSSRRRPEAICGVLDLGREKTLHKCELLLEVQYSNAEKMDDPYFRVTDQMESLTKNIKKLESYGSASAQKVKKVRKRESRSLIVSALSRRVRILGKGTSLGAFAKQSWQYYLVWLARSTAPSIP